MKMVSAVALVAMMAVPAIGNAQNVASSGSQVPGSERLLRTWNGSLPQYGRKVDLYVTSVNPISGTFGYSDGASTAKLQAIAANVTLEGVTWEYVLTYDILNGTLRVNFKDGKLVGLACTHKCSTVNLEPKK